VVTRISKREMDEENVNAPKGIHFYTNNVYTRKCIKLETFLENQSILESENTPLLFESSVSQKTP